ncbi:D-alanyl-D-alanine carboxypeptidase [Thalassobacillus cyri]|uniref:D-alanyl-D-alanine carboxypeptidase n=1 Tax=Thalassobacillus cyri TaxID=571932 RepID=A0A1H4GHB7_9BACI|nr:M15 family metallopeptidase [Thalassobacillus cyri]SEB09013.1 D-alanyl-D-alanine carboxypeptidase [Thalassobacillus cyri]
MKHLYITVLLFLLVIGAGCSGVTNENNSNSTSSDSSSQQENPDKEKGPDDTEGFGADSDQQADQKETDTGQKKSQNDNQSENETKDKQTESDSGDGSGSELVTVKEPHAITVVVNKNRKLPEGFEPKNLTVPEVPFPFDEFHQKKQLRLEAAEALEELFRGAKQDGVELVAASGYRSYERQKQIYQNNVSQNGKEHANQFSAKPGTSEHQTGLAMDVTSAAAAFKLEQSFIETKEGKWLEDNAHEYGFIIRYPEGKSDITGYAYEPWHLRYVGIETATEIHQEQETLEEFFGLYP